MATSTPPLTSLALLNGSNGFRMLGANPLSGWSANGAGDVNGDGFADLIVGTFSAGATHVVFGKAGGFAPSINLAALNGADGFRLAGAAAGDQSGFSATAAGDVNGDGFDDLIVGAPYADPNGIDSGSSYVVFGRPSGFAASINLGTLTGADGFRLDGVAPGGNAGHSVRAAGDINGDGLGDLFVGAWRAGASYVVFGKAAGFAPSISLGALTGADGFRLNGAGWSLAAGDVNGDGLSDLIVAAHFTNTSYVVFGRPSGFAANIDLGALTGADGFRLAGAAAGGLSSPSVSAGDINGDGFADVIVGVPYADPNGVVDAGSSYVVFGKAGGFAASVDLGALTPAVGFRVDGAAANDRSGFAVPAGDINGDGLADLVGHALNDPGGLANAGSSYVLFGRPSGFAATVNLGSLTAADGFRLNGLTAGAFAGASAAGDVNGDGFDDLIVGALGASTSYVVFGGNFTGAVTDPGTAGNDILAGTAADDRMIGGLGNDTISGLDGNDTLLGNEGDDTLIGAAGDDRLEGDVGNDSLVGGVGFDVLVGGAGGDHLFGDSNPETLNSAGQVIGGQGDIMLGGPGNDTYHVDSPLDFVDEGFVFASAGFGGIDTIESTSDFFWDVYGIGETIMIMEGARDPENDGTTIIGGVLNNVLIGNSGTNVIFGRGGADTYRAGDGVDFMSLSLLGVPETLYAGVNGVNTIVVEKRTSGPFSYDIVFEFEVGKDKLNVADYGFASAAAVLSLGVNDGLGNSYFVLGDGLDYLYMVGLTTSQLSAGDFII